MGIAIAIVIVAAVLIGLLIGACYETSAMSRAQEDRERRCQASLRDIGPIDPEWCEAMMKKHGRSRGTLSDKEYWAAAEIAIAQIADGTGHGEAPDRYGPGGIHEKLHEWAAK